ncbi:MAG: hypothetical protein WBE44_11580 [Terriglobales bacterium]|jgi:hypothetical protein
MEIPEKQTTLGSALLITNIGLPIVAANFYFFKIFPPRVVIESIGVAFVVLNVYYVIAFKAWGSRSK